TCVPARARSAPPCPGKGYPRGGAPGASRVPCRKSRLYHSGAVAERLHTALEPRLGSKVHLGTPPGDTSEGHLPGTPSQLFVVRLERDVCTVSADSSGELLHQRGYRGPQAKAPLRETLGAALVLAAG